MCKSDDLTRREKEIMVLLTQGKQNKEIAKMLCISINTVERHLKNIYAKLEARNRVEAIISYMGKNHGELG